MLCSVTILSPGCNVLTWIDGRDAKLAGERCPNDLLVERGLLRGDQRFLGLQVSQIIIDLRLRNRISCQLLPVAIQHHL